MRFPEAVIAYLRTEGTRPEACAPRARFPAFSRATEASGAARGAEGAVTKPTVTTLRLCPLRPNARRTQGLLNRTCPAAQNVRALAPCDTRL
ncbi:hypothetical protein NDU88_000738 [Pleurodeles waltl]|uniref:Uncharacterized protein n=1 Tax=Pleurodeles waltl TaxID=8319 RepID=A0AAV7SY05_PLEWA|nr:hypothetical protein NDU88_000738 [Pleurodeles waltl]